jgi:hypothetical protein
MPPAIARSILVAFDATRPAYEALEKELRRGKVAIHVIDH